MSGEMTDIAAAKTEKSVRDMREFMAALIARTEAMIRSGGSFTIDTHMPIESNGSGVDDGKGGYWPTFKHTGEIKVSFSVKPKGCQ